MYRDTYFVAGFIFMSVQMSLRMFQIVSYKKILI